MPAVMNQAKMNGFNKLDDHSMNGMDDASDLKAKLINKKLGSIGQQLDADKSNEGDVFHDTRANGAHLLGKQLSGNDDEPITVFDTQSNTSIAQTARDQFAAALLRLQSGLDKTTSRLDNIETRVDDVIRQQQRQQTRVHQEAKASKKLGGWLSFSHEGRLSTLLYLSWPILVFVAMRAIERRALLKKLD